MFFIELIFTNTLFGFIITTVPVRFNGNIAEVDWKTSSDEVFRRYSYQYDGLNRLLKGSYSEPLAGVPMNDSFNEEMTYDLNGNIKTLKRFTKPQAGTTPEKIDDLVYNYRNGGMSNILDKITLPTGVTNNSSGYNALEGTFGYDANGNMNLHPDKSIKKIVYNVLNLPSVIEVQNGRFRQTYNYIYRSDGVKLKKTQSMGITQTDYLDGFQYISSENPCTGCPPPVPELQFVPTSEGYFDYVKNKYIYNYTDHLGNIRLSYAKNGTGTEVIEESNYYPFGLKHEGIIIWGKIRIISTSTMERSFRRRGCMIMEQDSICRILEDGVSWTHWRKHQGGLRLIIMR